VDVERAADLYEHGWTLRQIGAAYVLNLAGSEAAAWLEVLTMSASDHG
jgi:hypothetical protein